MKRCLWILIIFLLLLPIYTHLAVNMAFADPPTGPQLINVLKGLQEDARHGAQVGGLDISIEKKIDEAKKNVEKHLEENPGDEETEKAYLKLLTNNEKKQYSEKKKARKTKSADEGRQGGPEGETGAKGATRGWPISVFEPEEGVPEEQVALNLLRRPPCPYAAEVECGGEMAGVFGTTPVIPGAGFIGGPAGAAGIQGPTGPETSLPRLDRQTQGLIKQLETECSKRKCP